MTDHYTTVVIVGTRYKGRLALDTITLMRPDEAVELRRSTAPGTLKHDANAIECHYAGVFVGFISRLVNLPIARAFDTGKTPIATVVEGGRVERGYVKTEPKLTVRWSD